MPYKREPRMSDAEFLNEWNREGKTPGGNLLSFASSSGYKPGTARKRMLELRPKNKWRFADLVTLTTAETDTDDDRGLLHRRGD